MFYFTEKVVNLKAWQLYLGNAFWTLFVGIVVLLIAKLLGFIGLESHIVDDLLSKSGQIAEARNPEILQHLPRYVSHPTHPHPTHPHHQTSEEFYSQ